MTETHRLPAAVEEIPADLIDRRIARAVAISRGVARLLAVIQKSSVDRGKGHPSTDDELSLQRIRAAIDAGTPRSVAFSSEARRCSAWGGKRESHAKRLRKKIRAMENANCARN